MTFSILSYQRKCYRYSYALQNTKAVVHSSNSYTDFCDIVTGVLQEDTLALIIFPIFLDYFLNKSMKKTASHKKARKDDFTQKLLLMQTKQII